MAILALLGFGLGGCNRVTPGACENLVYKDGGLSQTEYLPCARAMVDELDLYHQALKLMGDTSLPTAEREKGHRRCLASNARLTKLIRNAGGTEKLAMMPWDDLTLSRINRNIMTARDVYLMYCFYGVRGADKFKVDEKEDGSHVDARRELEQFRQAPRP